MNRNSLIKGAGYLVSTLSVFLLGMVSWGSTKGDPLMRTLLIGGMAASVVGMGLRWHSHRLEMREEGKK
ncbi:MAG: hypothetical protein J7494_09610 [Sphingobium sp.]|nr:hypothetical protein [Sphingobium sp.]